MKSRKGFTLIEIIVVVVIITIVSLIIVPSIQKYLKKGTSEYYSSLEDMVLLAGRDYLNDYKVLYPKEIGNVEIIKLDELENNNYIKDVVDSNGNKCDAQITVKKVDEDNYEYYSCLICDDYQSDENSCDYTEDDNIAPDSDKYSIIVENDKNYEMQNGIYIVDQGEAFEIPYGKAYYDGQLVDSQVVGRPKIIDTNQLGTTVISYSYKGAKASITVKVVDRVSPSTPQVVLRYDNKNGNLYNGGWYSGNIYQEFLSTDYTKPGLLGSGVKEYQFSSDGNSYTTLSSNYRIDTENGIHRYYVRSKDKSEYQNISDVNTYEIKIDKEIPVCKLKVTSGTSGKNGWYISDVTVGFEDKYPKDEVSGIKSQTITPNTITSDTKDKVVTGTVIDQANNEGTCTIPISVDKTNPVISYNLNNEIYSSNQTLKITTNDTYFDYMNINTKNNGVTVNNDSNVKLNPKSYTLSHGTWTVYTKAYDLSGRNSELSKTYIVDTVKPTCELEVKSGTPGNSPWYISGVTVGFKSTDGTGTSVVSSSISQTSITTEGTTTVTGMVTDQAGNVGTCSITVQIEIKLPTTSVTYIDGYNVKAYQGYYKIQLSSSSTYSGIKNYEIDWNNDGIVDTTTTSIFEPWDGWWSDNNTRFRAVTNAGNYGPWTIGYSIFRNASIAINPLADGNYAIRTMGNTDYSLDISGGNILSGTNIALWNYTGGNPQKWYIQHLGSGYYKITPTSNNSLSLDIVDGNQADGTNIRLWSWNNSNAQKFIVLTAVDGGYFLMSSNGYMIDVSEGNFTGGTNIQLWSYIGGAPQRWEFRSITDPIIAYTSWSDWTEVSGCENSDTVNCKTETIPGTGAQHYQCIYNTDECNNYTTTEGQTYYGTTAPSGNYSCLPGTTAECKKWDWNNLNKTYKCPNGYTLSDTTCRRTFSSSGSCSSACGKICMTEYEGNYVCTKEADVEVTSCNEGWVGPVDASDNPLGKSCWQYQYTIEGGTYCSEYKTATKDVTSCGSECTSCNEWYKEDSERTVIYQQTRSAYYQCSSGTLVGNSCIH